MNLTDEEEVLLRRVFGLTYLYIVDQATYRQVLNPDRSSEEVSALDYMKTDYNYVSLKGKEMMTILQRIFYHPGGAMDTAKIMEILVKWGRTSLNIPLQSYALNETHTRLILDASSLSLVRPLVVVDVCPRSNNLRVSFNLHFIKRELPDLMGDRSVQNIEGSFISVDGKNDYVEKI